MVQCPFCFKEFGIAEIEGHLEAKHSEKSEDSVKDEEVSVSVDLSADLPTDQDESKSDNDDIEIQEVKYIEKPSLPQTRTPQAKRSNSNIAQLLMKKPKLEPRKEPPISPQLLEQPQPFQDTRSAENIRLLKLDSVKPLAERLRPKKLEDYIGQSHLVGPEGILRGFIDTDRIPSMILWGPPGVGKTSIARIISTTTKSRFVEISATMNNTADIKKIFEDSKNEIKLTRRRTVLFCDEIHRFNKTQQDIFLPYVEKGDIILIGATTENPSFQLNGALLSRCRVFVLEKLSIEEIGKVIHTGILVLNKTRKLIWNQSLIVLDKDSINYLSDLSDGDSRSALNLLELVNSHYHSNKDTKQKEIITVDDLKKILKKTHMLYDRVGEQHYDTISAFHKSVRGSNPDAAMYYLARMLEGGENPLYIARRMIRIASEDVGVLDDSCLPFAVATYQAVQFVGLPEADLALVHCCVKLARAPKSVEIYKSWGELKSLMKSEVKYTGSGIPMHLRNAPTKLMKELDYGKEYKYNPNYKDGLVKQTYFPQEIGETRFLTGKHLGDLIDEDL